MYKEIQIEFSQLKSSTDVRNDFVTEDFDKVLKLSRQMLEEKDVKVPNRSTFARQPLRRSR